MEPVLTENSNNNLETTYVKEVYEEIAPHFSNTRVYKWSWVIDFLDSLKKDAIVYDLGVKMGEIWTTEV